MTADSFDSLMGFLLMGTGNDNNQWGTNANNSVFTPMARALGGKNVIDVTTAVAGVIDLSTVVPPAGLRLDIDMIQVLTNALTANVTIKLPNNGKVWIFKNNTTGNFQVLLRTITGTNFVNIPQGSTKIVYSPGDGTLSRTDIDDVGQVAFFASTSVPPSWLAISQQSLVRTDFPELFAKIGTTWGSADGLHFTLPLGTDTGRYLRSSSGSLTVGTSQANQNLAHTHTVTGAPGLGTLSTDTQGSHNHTITDNGHSHTLTMQQNNGVGGGSTFVAYTAYASSPVANTIAPSTSTSTTGITLATAGSHSHNVTGAPSLGSLTTASSGSAEARPESLVMLACIKY